MSAALALALAAVSVRCGGPAPTPPPASVPQAFATSPSPSEAVPMSPPRTVSVAPVGVAADPSLLDLVPASEVGALLEYDPVTTASISAEPALARDVSYLATGLARMRDAPVDDPNLVIVNLVRLRDPASAADDEWFRDWRDTYDEAACARAGGVARHAATVIDGLPVFIAACANEAFTYHVRVGDGAVILSMTSLGPADLGRRIVERLHR